MKRFKTTVTRTDEYIIEIDENVIDEQWMDDFRKHFYRFDSYEEHAEHIAQIRAKQGEGFIEGYGSTMIDGKPPWWSAKDYERGINIIVKSEGKDCEVEVEEIE